MRPFAADTFLEALAASDFSDTLPVLPVRDGRCFPEQRMIVAVGRPCSFAAIERARATRERHVVVLAQRVASDDQPTRLDDFFSFGCVARLFAEQDRADGGRDVMLVGRSRARALAIEQRGAGLTATIEVVRDLIVDEPTDILTMTALREITAGALQLAWSVSKTEARRIVDRVPEAGPLADLVIAYLKISDQDQQRWLEELDVRKRVAFVLSLPRSARIAVNARPSWFRRVCQTFIGPAK